MKKTYEELELEVIRFKTEDIITTSEVMKDNVTPELDYTGAYEVLSERGMIFVKPVGKTPDGKVIYIDVTYGEYWIQQSDGTYVSYP